MTAADNTDSEVRTSALAALGMMGDDSAVPLLAGRAASATGLERTAARQSLLTLSRGSVTRHMLELLKTAAPPVKSELMRALGGRGDQTAVPALLNLAQNGDDTERAAALQTLGLLANGAQIPDMVQMVAKARTDEIRAAAADALNAIFERLKSFGAKYDVSAFAAAAAAGSIETRLALLPLCSELTEESVRGAVRGAAAESDARIRVAGLHALYETKDAELMADLLKLACNTNQPGSRLTAIRSCVRLSTQEETVKLSNEAKLGVLSVISATPLDTQEKRLVLSGLGNIIDEKALKLATEMLDDSAIQAEAQQAVILIATNLAVKSPAEAKAALKQVVAATDNPTTKKSAEDALKKIK